MSILSRKREQLELNKLLLIFPAAAILGPRQCGKTTLAKQMKAEHYFDLENPQDERKFESPQLLLEELHGTIVIDEIQRKPELFPLLRFLIDSHPNQKYILLGSASRDLIRQSSETLAGRIGYLNLRGFGLNDVKSTDRSSLNKLWVRGGFPRSWLETNDETSFLWRENYIRTFLERDIPQLGIRIPSTVLRRFWIMLSHYHGNILNYSELSRSFGISEKTVKHYLSILEGTFMIRLLQPWRVNLKKRLVKSPKLLIRDSGIFHYLQSITSYDNLISHNKLGASWEGFVIEEASRYIPPEEMFFYRTHNGTELDLFWRKEGKSYGLEVKYNDAPSLTSSMKIAIKDLNLEKLFVVYPGEDRFLLKRNVEALSLPDFLSEI